MAVFSAEAQKSALQFQGGLNVGIPAHNLGGTSLGLGADLLAHLSVTSQVAITGDIGYTALLGKNGGGTSNLVPIRAGVRVYPSEDFFVGGKIGAGIISNDGSSVTTTAYSFGIGYKAARRIELGASYDGYSKNGTVGLINLRLGYFFN